MTILISENESDLYKKMWGKEARYYKERGDLFLDRRVYDGSLHIILDTFNMEEPLNENEFMFGPMVPNVCNIIEAVLINTVKTDFGEYELNLCLMTGNLPTDDIRSILIDTIDGTDPEGTYSSMFPNFIQAEKEDFLAIKNITPYSIMAPASYLLRLVYTRT